MERGRRCKRFRRGYMVIQRGLTHSQVFNKRAKVGPLGEMRRMKKSTGSSITGRVAGNPFCINPEGDPGLPITLQSSWGFTSRGSTIPKRVFVLLRLLMASTFAFNSVCVVRKVYLSK